MSTLNDFESVSGGNSGSSAGSDGKSDDIVELQGEGSRFERKLRERSQGLDTEKDDQDIEVL